jgi:hypothetical protein
MTQSRVVLCRPQGGLNDVLCQIERVCRYAERFDRIVIIDTNHHSTKYIKDNFSRYFVSKQKGIILDIAEAKFELKNVDVFPQFLTGSLFGYDAHFDRDLGYFVENKTHKPITFDFTKDYAEPVLVHHASGRLRGASVAALSRLRLHDSLYNELAKRLNSIGQNYDSLHIRNTDYKTSYQQLLNQLKGRPALSNCENLFVATDDVACLQYCKNNLKGINVVSFSQLPQESGRPIHWLSEGDNIYERNKDAILDLLMLALARKFFFLEIDQNRWGARYSGFAVLALDLRNSKPILNQLLSKPKIDVNPIK